MDKSSEEGDRKKRSNDDGCELRVDEDPYFFSAKSRFKYLLCLNSKQDIYNKTLLENN